MTLGQPQRFGHRYQFEVKGGTWVSVAVALGAVGCAPRQPDPNEALFKKAADELPAAEAAATRVGLHFQLDYFARDVPSSENAAFLYDQAKTFSETVKRPDIMPTGFDSKSVATITKYLDQLEPAMKLAEKAAALPHCDFRYGQVPNIGFGSGIILKGLCSYFALRAGLEAHGGHYADAGRDIGLCGRFTAHMIDGKASLGSSQMAQTMLSSTVRACDRIVTDQHGNPECAKHLAIGLAKFPTRMDLPTAIETEAAMNYRFLTYSVPEGSRGLGNVPEDNSRQSALANAAKWFDTRMAMRALAARDLQLDRTLYGIAKTPSITDRERVSQMATFTKVDMSKDITHFWEMDMSYSWRIFLIYPSQLRGALLGLDHLATPASPWPRKIDPCTDWPFRISTRPGGFSILSEPWPSDNRTPSVRFEYPFLRN